MRFLKWLRWPHLSDETQLRSILLLFGLAVGLTAGIAMDEYSLKHEYYEVYSEGAVTPWKIKGLLNAEKKARWLVYGCDCKVAVIVGADHKVIDQVRTDDGRDIPSAQ
jgi:hypothetical protein